MPILDRVEVCRVAQGNHEVAALGDIPFLKGRVVKLSALFDTSGPAALEVALRDLANRAQAAVEALRRAGPKPSRDKILAALEGLRKLDLGGLEVSFSPEDHTGLDFADLSIIGADGKFKR